MLCVAGAVDWLRCLRVCCLLGYQLLCIGAVSGVCMACDVWLIGDLAECLTLLTCRHDVKKNKDGWVDLQPEEEKEQIERITTYVVRKVQKSSSGGASSPLEHLRYFFKGDAEQEHDMTHHNVSCGRCMS
jgi:hypothetical protein